ncbi:hypothetical protein NP7_08495 [Moraxella osloensis]|uniref:Uncharacterized protein n=1 Tax=Faucicola osloensis TaxID=34062 RepID=A0A2D2LW86_FAUOS|nr:hypothetical protein NP7_08495 [Moraxella osloensis]
MLPNHYCQKIGTYQKSQNHIFYQRALFFVSQSQASQIQASQIQASKIQDRRQAYSIPPNFVKIGKNLSS